MHQAYLAASLSQELRDIVVAAIIFGVAVAISLASRYILRLAKMAIASRTKTSLDDLIIEALTVPLGIVIVLAGTYIALNQISVLDDHRELIRTIFVVCYIMLGAVAVGRGINVVLTWYGSEIATRTKTDLDEKLIPVFRRIVTVVVYAIGFVIVLDRLGVNISPLIAGLGISGLAVALALQPTLSNFLAGTYVMGDGVIRKGHYISLDSGQEGTVEEIGWRTTKLRHWQGNLIVMPNSKLAEAVVTNYDVPDAPMVFAVDCGVSYDSDLKKVERVTVEVATQLLQELPQGAKDFTPVVRFKRFGDSNIDFAIVLKSVNRVGQFVLKHELIKRLHERFNQEGIEIQYPARKLYFSDGHAPWLTKADLARLAERAQPPASNDPPATKD